ncbi:hypothetical protein, partial [Shewanella sairae]|uniref:hypothetical protein n=1 Tax=Shewanella sairae TaxID=190310 RepID=UPI001C824804
MSYFHFDDDDKDDICLNDELHEYQYQLPNEKMKLTCFFDVHVFKDHVPQGTMRIRNEKVRFQWIQ